MGKKLTYEYVKEYFEKEGCELLENEYIGIENLMSYRCRCNNISKIDFKRFKRGVKCLRCVGKEKPSFNTVFNKFKESGKILLDTEYINNSTPMNYICVCGNQSKITWGHFNDNNYTTCRKCKNLEKYTFKYVKEYIESFGYTLLSEEYKTARINLKIKCPNNHIYGVPFSTFKNSNSRCRKCYEINNSGENNIRWKEDRTIKYRLNYLKYTLTKTNIIRLSNDPLYTEYLKNKTIYNVDHIYPRSAFIDNNLDKIYSPKYIKNICNSRDNLRIILKEENLKKHSKYNQEEFMKWFNIKMMKENNFVFN